MPKVSVLFARFPFFDQEVPASTDWMIETVLKASKDKRISDIFHTKVDDTPITASRNRVFEYAKRLGVDLLLMIDADMHPDIGMKPETRILSAKPFWDTALDFMLAHNGPCVIGAPYCGPPPHENVYVFRPRNRQSNHPNIDVQIEQFTREEAAERGGIEEVFALPTGLVLIDMRCVEKLRFPYFDYDWKGDGPCCKVCGQPEPGPRAERASTEDVYWSRNLALAGVKQYVAWDCWAGHKKRKLVGKPTLLTMDAVRQEYRDAIVKGKQSDEQLISDVRQLKPTADMPLLHSPTLIEDIANSKLVPGKAQLRSTQLNGEPAVVAPAPKPKKKAKNR